MRWVVAGALSGESKPAVLRRSTIIAMISFLTLIDLFGSQALLPQLVVAYKVDAATMGVAVNASTFGMALAGLTIAWFADRIDRKKGIWISLALLSIPTALLSVTTDVTMFAALRVLQGICMASAFTLTATYLSEQCDITAASGALAAYITGNVASNLFGRLMAGSLAEQVGLEGSFLAFAALNLAGAALAYSLIGPTSGGLPARSGPPLDAWRAHLANAKLRAAFLIGFVILFLFVGVFTYVNFELVGPRLGVDPMMLGAVYFVFLPSLFTTPAAGPLVQKHGAGMCFQIGGLVTLAGLALCFAPSLWAVLAGLALVAVGLFFAQAAVSGFIGRAATHARAAANGLYLSSYYFGGLAGAAALGQVYAAGGWSALVAVSMALTLVAMALARAMRETRAASTAG